MWCAAPVRCHHVAVAYFTAVLARSGRSWRARDVDLDDADTLDDLVDLLRSVGVDDEPVLAVVEHEDEWFALVRVDGDEEPRLFVSDLVAADRSSYRELLSSAADVEIEDDGAEQPVAAGGAGGTDVPGASDKYTDQGDAGDELADDVGNDSADDAVDDAADDAYDDADEDEDAGADDDEDEDAGEPVQPELRAWAGEPDLLEDLGVSGRMLRGLVQDKGEDPAGVLAEVGEAVGFGELLAALR